MLSKLRSANDKLRTSARMAWMSRGPPGDLRRLSHFYEVNRQQVAEKHVAVSRRVMTVERVLTRA